MKTLLILFFISPVIIGCTQQNTSQDVNESAASTAEKNRAIEFADSSYHAIGKKGLQAMVDQNVEAFTASFSEDVTYIFNNGDTLKGKPAITEYWRGRMEAIDNISFSNDIWLSLKVNESDQVQTGNWLLAWFDVTATYTSGNTMSQTMHIIYHFNTSDQIDVVIQFLDRLPIAQAQGN